MVQRGKQYQWRPIVWLVWLWLLAGSAVAHTDGPDSTAADGVLDARQQAIVEVLDAYATAYAATDLAAIRGLILDDGHFSYFEGASADWGWDAYAEHAAAEMPSFSEAQYVFSNIRPEVGKDFAFATFGWKMDVVVVSDQFEGGRHPISMQGIGTAVLLLEEGVWKLRHLQTVRAKPPKVSPK